MTTPAPHRCLVPTRFAPYPCGLRPVTAGVGADKGQAGMEVVYHIGAHCTDDGQLIAALLKNRTALLERGVVVGYPGRYRTPLREAIHSLRGAPASPELQQTLLDTIATEDRIDRLVLSNEHFLGTTPRALGGGVLYPLAEARAASLANLFPGAGCELHLAIRNPAAFLPAVVGRVRDMDADTLLAGIDPMALAWSDVVARLRAGAPRAKLVVWCDEDTPLIWPEVLRSVAGAGDDLPLAHGEGRLAEVMSRDGMARMEAWLAAHPPVSITHRRRVAAAFLDKYALDEALEEEMDLPGWTAAHVAALTEAYDADTARIAAMEDVTFLTI